MEVVHRCRESCRTGGFPAPENHRNVQMFVAGECSRDWRFVGWLGFICLLVLVGLPFHDTVELAELWEGVTS